jgi:hypothetical protein
MNRIAVIIGSFLVAIIAFIALAFSNVSGAVQALITLPGSAGLLYALWQIIQLNIEHQHRLEEKRAENDFILSATSHMAERAFDKHVEFCEEYLKEVDEGLKILFQEGPTTKALRIAESLYKTRRRFIVWETPDVAQLLDKFEMAFSRIGASNDFVSSLGASEERAKIVAEMYALFKDVTTFRELPNNPTPDIAIASIIAGLRDHLGITKLTTLRKHYLDEAMKRAK